MQIGVSSYSFSRLVRRGEIQQIDVIAEAKAIGFDVIEFSTLSLPDGEDRHSFAPKLKAAAEQHELPIASYTISADLLNGSDGDLSAEVERVKEEVRVAQALGVPCMRHDATRGYPPEKTGARSFDHALPRLAEGVRAITEYAAELDIKTTVENHGFFCQDSERVEKLVAAVDHENFGVLFDMGNFLCGDEDPALAAGRLAGSVFHVHAKDFHTKPGTAVDPGEGWFRSRAGNYLRGAVIGHGDVPITQCLRVLRKGGYDGVCSIEFEGLEDVRRGLQIGLANLRRFVAETE